MPVHFLKQTRSEIILLSKMFYCSKYYLLIVLLLVSWVDLSIAGFLDMPEIKESPEIKYETMLKDLSIPSVRERDPDPQAGPRLAVSKFKIQGLVEHPEFGITKNKISHLVEEIRFKLMNEDKLLESGYTQEEISELSDLLVDIEKETINRHVTSYDLQKVVWLIRDQRSKRGITLGQIESAADTISKYYRKNGFILAKAYIPKQEVRDGVVNLTLLLGKLGEVVAEKNEIYDEQYIESLFSDMIGKPVTNQWIEEKLYLINDLPGISMQGIFEPGYQVGDTRLRLNMTDYSKLDTNIRLDNHGTESTGEYRFYTNVLWNNPSGYSDQFVLSLLKSGYPDNNTYGEFYYSTKYFSPVLQVGTGFSKNQFILGPGDSETIDRLELNGETNQLKFDMIYTTHRSRRFNGSFGLNISEIESLIRYGILDNDSDVGIDDKVLNRVLSYKIDRLNEKDKVLHQADFSINYGKFIYGRAESQENNYEIVNSNYTSLSFWNIPFTSIDSRIIFHMSLQYTDAPQSSINQFLLGGPTRARAYPTSFFSADNALFLATELIFNTPDMIDFNITDRLRFKDVAQPFLFMDYGYGEQFSLIDTSDDIIANIADVGFGLKFSYLNNFNGNLQIAYPINQNINSDDFGDEDKSSRIVFDFQYKF